MRRLPAALLLLITAGTACRSVTAPQMPGVVPLTFQEGATTERYAFTWSDSASPYLDSLRTRYPMSSVIAGATTDYARVQAVSRWVRGRWQHNGDNVAVPGDPISILDQAAKGQRFRCVEYAVVVAGVLQSIGVRARVLGLKTSDVETRATGAGHVVAEAFLRETGRWVMVDGQWDAIPTLDGQPLDAVSFQRALASHARGLSVMSLSSTNPSAYFSWVGPYLYYFDSPLDQRLGVARRSGSLMLVPLGSPNPTVFQQKFSIGAMTYTSALAAFYAAPADVP